MGKLLEVIETHGKAVFLVLLAVVLLCGFAGETVGMPHSGQIFFDMLVGGFAGSMIGIIVGWAFLDSPPVGAFIFGGLGLLAGMLHSFGLRLWWF
jgi:hypothetical protein